MLSTALNNHGVEEGSFLLFSPNSDSEDAQDHGKWRALSLKPLLTSEMGGKQTAYCFFPFIVYCSSFSFDFIEENYFSFKLF